MSNTYIRKILVMTAAAFALAGCTKENTDDCYNVSLRFEYKYKDNGTDTFADKVENVDVNVFDAATGAFVTSKILSKAELRSFQGTRLHLDPGTYRIVCWGNMFEHTSFIKTPTVADAYTLHTSRESGIAANDDPMYYAPRIADMNDPDKSQLIITVPASGVVDRLVKFTAAHKTIEVFVKGFSDGSSMLPEIEVTNLASIYNFSMQTLSEKPISFEQLTRSQTRAETYAVATFHTAHFNEDNNVTINIVRPSTDAVLHSISLAGFLADNNVVLTSGDWDYIPIYVEFNDLGVVVSVTKWSGTPVTPGVD